MRKKTNRNAICVTLVHICILLLQFFTASCASKETNIPDEVKQSIEERIKNGEGVGFIVGFIDPQGHREYLSYGTLTKNGEQPVDERSIYEIGSISKAFTCVALADLVLKGELSLDDPAEMYLPETVKMPSKNGEKILRCTD